LILLPRGWFRFGEFIRANLGPDRGCFIIRAKAGNFFGNHPGMEGKNLAILETAFIGIIQGPGATTSGAERQR
jgi:hypothetical protein